jgi:predicted nucleic acid-binding protein
MAATIFRRLEREAVPLFTTRYVLAETHAIVLARRRSPREALALLTRIEYSVLTTLVSVSDEDERRAREILTKYDDKQFSLTDAISFAVIDRLNIPVVLTFDDDFKQYGLHVLTV